LLGVAGFLGIIQECRGNQKALSEVFLEMVTCLNAMVRDARGREPVLASWPCRGSRAGANRKALMQCMGTHVSGHLPRATEPSDHAVNAAMPLNKKMRISL